MQERSEAQGLREDEEVIAPRRSKGRARALLFFFLSYNVHMHWNSIAGLASAAALALPLAATAELPVVTLNAGLHLIQAEIANTDASRMQGLMYRKSLEANRGMLFVF